VPSRVNVANPDLVMRHLARGRVWLAGALLGVVLGGLFYWATPAKFSATSVVELTAVSPTIDLGAVRGRPRLESVDTDANMLGSDEVVSSVAKASGDSELWARSSLSVAARNLTRVVEVTYTSATPEGARAGANSAADGLLVARQRLVIQPVEDYLSEVAKRTETPLDAEVVNPDDRFGTAEFRVENWRDRALAARLQLPHAGTVLERATASTGAERGPMEVPLTSGAALGALVAVLLGIGFQRLRAGRVRQVRRIQLVVRQGSALLKARGLPAVDAAPASRFQRHPALRAITIVVTVSLVGLGLGYAGATRLDSGDLGRSTVLLRPLPGNAFSTRNGDTAIDLKTDGQVALSDAVLGPVVTAFHNGLTVEVLRSRLTVKLVDNAEVVIITYKGRGAAPAIDVVKRVAEQLLTVRTALAKAAYQDQASLITPELSAAEARAAENVKGADEGKDQNGEAQTILNQRVVSLRSELRAVKELPPGPGSVLATTAPRQAGVRKLQLAIIAASWMLATSVGILLAARKPRPRRRPGKGASSGDTTITGEVRAA
jgi:capsular polysaccharide biosynthesis protein